jgi:hypothetical protein
VVLTPTFHQAHPFATRIAIFQMWVTFTLFRTGLMRLLPRLRYFAQPDDNRNGGILLMDQLEIYQIPQFRTAAQLFRFGLNSSGAQGHGQQFPCQQDCLNFG